MPAQPDPGSGKPAADPASQIAAFWAEWFAQSNEQARAILEALQGAGDPQAMQKRWLDAMAQCLDGFMRSPAFLEAMQRNLKMMTDLKGLQDQVIEDTARHTGAPLASDITGLFERLDSAERALQARLKAIEDRLTAIEAKLTGPTPASPG
jgi:hypothetical protein